MINVTIVGAGVSGLVLAYRAEQAGWSPAIFEMQNRLGGAIRTVEKNGFVLEYGPNSVRCSQQFIELVRELGLEGEIVRAKPRAAKRFIARLDSAGRLALVDVPRGPLGTVFSPLLSLSTKCRLLLEPLVRRSRSEDESVYDFSCRRVSRQFADEVVAPALTGIWAGNIHELSCRTTLPKVWQGEQRYGSVIFGLLADAWQHPKRDSSTPRGVVSFVSGMHRLPARLVERLERTELFTSTGATPEKIRSNERVALTVSAPRAADFLRLDDPELAALAERVPYAPVGLLHLAVRADAVRHPLDGFGFLVPPLYGKSLRGVLFSSSTFPGRAPEGFHLLTCITGSDVREHEVQQRVFAELDEALGLALIPEVLDATYIAAAIPNYPVGHHRLQQAVERFHASQERVRVVGSWYKGVSVPQRIEAALL